MIENRSLTVLNISALELQQLIEQAVARAVACKGKPALQAGEDELLTASEACKVLSISRTTLWQYCKEDRLKSHTFGGRRIYFKRSELLAAMSG